MNIKNLEDILGYYFNNKKLLKIALTHRSFGAYHNERLEFMGDSILNFIISFLLFKKFPNLNEGKLSYFRANLVNKNTLLKIANDLKLSNYISLGEGELKSGGMFRSSILADTVEAIIGAIFIDSNFLNTLNIVENKYSSIIKDIDSFDNCKDSKTLLQEYLQKRKKILPNYKIISIYGKAHNQRFEIECSIDQLNIKTKAIGNTRKSAEQEAAKIALANLVKFKKN
ncbi:Ribonuclease 3 [Candidatus Kinetoplastibacterium sorsogonicusi]|uniref:Ribonuclease 3 n=1 Tax=Candidatus Kinetoplastidibacterium kentomonadis TaxID=1576550 RepID=A0A3S7JA50_9PROT|nr:ribonuclease III [Candidatus Kinetoplastibacterium sorsogonicusi]AWD32552.1 Ribonuclease 3 [Candidatus Kinetoplastibacterium sorsogonicusi]